MAVRLVVAVAVLGATLVAVGVGMWSLAAGFVVGGGEMLAGAYVAAYLQAKGGR